MLTQVDAGVCCPLSMTYAGYPILHRYLLSTNKTLANSFPLNRVLSRKYDKRCVPASIKSGLTLGKTEVLINIQFSKNEHNL